MATIRKKAGKWQGLIRRSFHKPISKTFISKQDAQRWARETERLIEVGQYVDHLIKTIENEKIKIKRLLEILLVILFFIKFNLFVFFNE